MKALNISQSKDCIPINNKGASQNCWDLITRYYTEWIENTVADALSRRPTVVDKQQMYSLPLVVIPSWMQHLENSYKGDTKATDLRQQLSIAYAATTNYQLKNGVLFYKTRMYVGDNKTLRQQLLESYHNSIVGGRSGVHLTYLKFKKYFY